MHGKALSGPRQSETSPPPPDAGKRLSVRPIAPTTPAKQAAKALRLRADRRRPEPPVEPPENPVLCLIHEHKWGTKPQALNSQSLSWDPSKEIKNDLERLPSRLERYASAHRRALTMGRHLDQLGHERYGEWKRRAEDLRTCGSYLLFREYFTEGRVRLHAAKFCQQDKLCPLCAIRRGAKRLRLYADRVLTVRKERPDLSAYLVTFTVKNGPNLTERFDHLRTALDACRQRRKDASKSSSRHRSSAWLAAAGGVMSIEVKRGSDSNQWHPHAHAAWLCPGEPNQHALRAEWEEVTRDSFSVDVRPFHHVTANETPTADLLAADFAEVFKYALKFSTMDLSDNVHAFDLLRGRRLISAFGVLYGVPEPTDLADDPIDDADLPFIEHFYKYFNGEYQPVLQPLTATVLQP